MQINRRTFLSSLTGLAGLATLPASAGNTTISFRQAFDRPAAQAKPWVRWWWPGGVVNDEELRREIKALKLAGFGGAEVQAFNPGIPNLTKEERTRLHDYANDAFFAHLQVCTDEARRHDMQIDSTFGSAWPSGGGFAITPEFALLELTPATTSITAPVKEPIRVTIPGNTRKFGALPAMDTRTQDPRAKDWRERMTARQKLVAVVAFRGEAPVLVNNKNYRTAKVKAAGSMENPAGIVLTDKLGPDGVLDWVPPSDGNWQIVVFKQFAVDSAVMAGVGEGPQLVLDHFNRTAFAAHAQRVGEPLKQAGRGLRATFIDSLELMPDIYWPENLLAEFQARRGYDLTPHLPHLMQPGWMEAWNPHTSLPYFASGEVGERIRADYRLTISQLLIENLWQPFVEWNHQRGLQARVQAHGGPSDLLQSYGLADIPETEDLESGASPHFLRLARAAANIYGRDIVSCESLCWIGKPYEVTPAQWLARANLLFVSGVNQLVMHGFPYALHKDKWPGWFPFEPSAFLSGFSSLINEANPLWAAIPAVNAYVSRAQSLLQAGKTAVNVAVLLTDIGYGSNVDEDKVEAWLQGLLDAGYDYDRINPDGLQHSRARQKAVQTPGGTRYSAIVVPATDGMAPDVLDQLVAYARAGVRIVFVDRVPHRSDSLRDRQADDDAVRQKVQALQAAGARIAAPAALAAALADAGIPRNVSFNGKPCLFIEKRLGAESLFVFHNPGGTEIELDCAVNAGGYPQIIDPFTGRRSGLKSTRHGAQTSLHFPIEAGGAAFVVFAAERLPVKTAPGVVATRPGPGTWTLSVDGHGHRGRRVQDSRRAFALADLSAVPDLADFSGQAVYSAGVSIDKAWLKPGASTWLDLGAVHDMAQVSVNGVDCGALLMPPFMANISHAVKPGENTIVVRVFNGPNNAMMDAKLPGLKNLTPKPAGLVGPVTLTLKA